MLYFNHFELSSLVVTLSVAASASSLSAARGRRRAFGGGSGNSFDAYKRAIGLVVTNLEDAHITLGGKRAENFGILSQSTLVSQLTEHYKAAALGEVYNILGSAKFLGNPVGLLNNLSTGLSEFYHAPGAGYEATTLIWSNSSVFKHCSVLVCIFIFFPYSFWPFPHHTHSRISYRLGADEFGAGVMRGSQRTTHGLFNTLSGITGSAAHGLASITADREFQRARADFQSTDRPKTAYAIIQMH